MSVCPTCGQDRDDRVGEPLTDAEIDALSAWWVTGTTKKAAALLGLAERTVVNQLYRARMRDQVHTTGDLIPLHIAQLRSMTQLMALHNERARKAA